MERTRLKTIGDIKGMKKAGINPERLKKDVSGSDRTGQLDLLKDRTGETYVKPKDGSGPGEPTGVNLNDLAK